MPTSSGNPGDDPGSTQLPPSNRESEPTGTSGGLLPTAGVSPKLKFFVIGLTFVTVMAFGVFIAMFIKKAFVKRADNPIWGPQLVIIAEELKNKGLKPQAIEHYQKYLDTQTVDMKTRSRISFDIATLYVELGKCDDAMAWFLHAKTAQPTAPWVQESENKLQQCHSRPKTPQQ